MKNLLFVGLLLIGFKTQAQDFTFRWRQISGPLQTKIETPDSSATRLSGLNLVGIYGYEIAVTDEFGTGKDSLTITVIREPLSIHADSVYHFTPPKITKLEIKAIARVSDIYLQIKSPRQQTIQCIIYDVTGKAIGKSDLNTREGINYITLPKPTVSGIYILHFITYWEAVSLKIII